MVLEGLIPFGDRPVLSRSTMRNYMAVPSKTGLPPKSDKDLD
jgi:hypothetical protein